MKESGLLAEIVQGKRSEVAWLASPEGRQRIETALREAPAPRDFRGALRPGAGYRIIAEMKRASPSRGVLSQTYEPQALAREYEAGGAAALSVLTEIAHFQGSPSHLMDARGASTLPVLRKDFMLDTSQVEESRALGADAVLLIAAILEPASLGRLLGRARALGMEALVEVHDARELSWAADSGAEVIGVNNRNLSSFEVDLEVSLKLAERFPRGVLKVSESGITRTADLELLSRAGYDAFLVGEALMTAGERGSRLRGWLR